MKIFISFPPLKGPGCPTLAQNRQFQWFSHSSHIYPMVPASAASLLKDRGYEVIWDDCIAEQRDEHDFWRRLREESPSLIAMETKTPVVRQHWMLTKRIKKALPQTKVILMGDHITARPAETMEASPCDFAITGGDYDFSLLSVVEHIKKGTPLIPGIWYRENGLIQNSGIFDHTKNNLDDLPWIDRQLTQWYRYGEKLYKRKPFTYTTAGRDCPYGKCTFCAWTSLFPKFRVRSPENLAEEIEYLVSEFGIREIFDDTGTFPVGGWLEHFCGIMIKKKLNRKIRVSSNFRYDYLTPARAKMMKNAGFRLLKLGLESANQDTLDRLRKGTTVDDIEKGCRVAREAGLEVHLTMMVGYPWEERSDAEKTVSMASRLMQKGFASMLQATIIIPYPGTPFYDEAFKRGWFSIDPYDYDKMDMSQPVLKTPDMSPNDIMQICETIYRSFLTPGYLFNQVLSIRNFDDVRYYLRGLKPVFGHLRDFGERHKNIRNGTPAENGLRPHLFKRNG